MAEILVTGASGFVGFHLVQTLSRQGHEITCLVRGNSNTELIKPLDVRLVEGDILDLDSLRRAIRGQDQVYHVAGNIKAINPRTLCRINGQGAGRVARACAEQEHPPLLLLVSSLAAAGPAPQGRPLEENDPPRPVSLYGRSKLMGERAVRRYADRLPITIVRPGLVFGEADRASLDLFRQIVKTRFHLSPGRHGRRYSMIHGQDLAELLILAAQKGERLPASCSGDPSNDSTSEPGCGIYFAACNQAPTFPEFGRLMADALGMKWLFRFSAGWPMTYAVAGVMELAGRLRNKPPVFGLDKAREGLGGPWLCSTDKARVQLGFQPAAPLPERLKQTVDWYRQHDWL